MSNREEACITKHPHTTCRAYEIRTARIRDNTWSFEETSHHHDRRLQKSLANSWSAPAEPQACVRLTCAGPRSHCICVFREVKIIEPLSLKQLCVRRTLRWSISCKAGFLTAVGKAPKFWWSHHTNNGFSRNSIKISFTCSIVILIRQYLKSLV